MRMNPIFKRELTVSARSKSLPAVICAVNALLFAVTLIGAAGVTASMSANARGDYGAFLRIYGLVAILEFLMLLFIAPSLTSGAISSERERETFDLMLTTQMRPREIITGTLMCSLGFTVVLELSCIPAMLVSLMYGGVTVGEIITLFGVYTAEAFLFMAAGIFFSSFSKSTAASSAFTYGFLAFLCFGTVVISFILSAISGGSNRLALLVLLFNPLANAAETVAGQMGERELLGEIFSRIYAGYGAELSGFWSSLGVFLQLLMAAGLICGAVANISPKRKKIKALDFNM